VRTTAQLVNFAGPGTYRVVARSMLKPYGVNLRGLGDV
jgi:hypothetical protein